MATAVIMPRQGQSVESCIITKWHKKVGDSVSVNDKLFTYETDKASFEEEAKINGVMLAIFFEEGDDVDCLINVCVIGEQGEDISSFAPNMAENGTDGESDGLVVPTTSTASITNMSLQPPADNLKRISPRARGLSERYRVDLGYACATGPNGRIIERDVEALIAERRHLAEQALPLPLSDGDAGVADKRGPTATEWEIIPISGIRKIIAKGMHASLTNTAQLTLHTSFDASDVMAFRKKAKVAAESFGLPVASITDIMVYAVSRTLMGHKNLNAHFLEDNTMKIFHSAHIGIAVDTPRGLLVPTVFNTCGMSLSQISAQAKSIYAMCAAGTVSPDLLQGASFTISNLGSMGIEMFTPILNPPQTGLLGVCSIIERTKNGATYPAMGLSLTFDHRAADGADAARFLQDLVKCLENFSVFAALV